MENEQGLLLDPRGEAWRRGELRERYGYVDSNLLNIIEGLKKWTEIGLENEQKERRKSLRKNNERLMRAQTGQLETILDLEMRFKNPYPFDSRQQEAWFKASKDALKKAVEEDWAKGEARQWIDRMALDLTWGENNFRVLEGMGGVLDKFFDWKKMLFWVRERYRSDPTASNYEGTFQKEIPGISISEKEKTSLPDELKEGTREKATKYQDECTFWRMAVAEVHQMSGGNPSFMRKLEDGEKTLSDSEIKFIRLVFEDREQLKFALEGRKGEEEGRKGEEELKKEYSDGIEKLIRKIDDRGNTWLIYEGEAVPRALLNWYAMGSIEEKKRYYLAIMETLLTMDAREKLRSIAPDDDQKMKLLADQVRGWAEQCVRQWYKIDRSTDEILAREIVRSGIVQDWGHFSATRLGWGWKYEIEEIEDEQGKKHLEVVRERVGGATTVATDAISAAYWRDYLADNESKPRTLGMFPPMSDDFRERLLKEAPDWKPEYLEKVAERDEKLQHAFQELWKNNEDYKWEEKVVEELKGLLWYWETPYEDEKGNPIVVPIFFPPEIASLNFWNTISLSGERDIEFDPTVWDELCGAKPMSEFEWIKMGDQGVYHWMITMGQIIRYLTVMVEPESIGTEVQFKDFFEDTSNLRELLKRTDIGTRGEKQSRAVLTMVLVPLLLSLRLARKYGIIGPAGFKKEERGKWGGEIAWWKNYLTAMPKDYGGVKGYAGGMVKLFRFYTKVFANLAVRAGKKEVDNLQKSYNETRSDCESVGVSLGPLVVKPPPKRKYEDTLRK